MALAIGFGSAREHGREGEGVQSALCFIVGSTGKEIGTLLGIASGLDLCTDDENDVGTRLNGIHTCRNSESTGSAGTLHTSEGRVGQAFRCSGGHRSQVSLIGEELSNKVADISAVDESRIDTDILASLESNLMNVLFEGRVLFLAEVGVLLPDEIRMKLSDEGGDGSSGNGDATCRFHVSVSNQSLTAGADSVSVVEPSAEGSSTGAGIFHAPNQ